MPSRTPDFVTGDFVTGLENHWSFCTLGSDRIEVTSHTVVDMKIFPGTLPLVTAYSHAG